MCANAITRSAPCLRNCAAALSAAVRTERTRAPPLSVPAFQIAVFWGRTEKTPMRSASYFKIAGDEGHRQMFGHVEQVAQTKIKVMIAQTDRIVAQRCETSHQRMVCGHGHIRQSFSQRRPLQNIAVVEQNARHSRRVRFRAGLFDQCCDAGKAACDGWLSGGAISRRKVHMHIRRC